MPRLCRCAYNIDCPVIELLNQDASQCVTNCPKKLLRPSAFRVAVTKQGRPPLTAVGTGRRPDGLLLQEKPVWCCWPGYWSAPAGPPSPAVQDTVQAARTVGSQALAAEAQCSVTCEPFHKHQCLLSRHMLTAPGQVLHLLLQRVERPSQYGLHAVATTSGYVSAPEFQDLQGVS